MNPQTYPILSYPKLLKKMYIRGLSKKYPTFIFPVRNRDDSAAPLRTVKEDTFMRMREFFHHHPARQLLPVGR